MLGVENKRPGGNRALGPLALFLTGTLLAVACGGGGGGGEGAAQLPATARPPRDARLVEAQVAFERGQPDVARTLLTQAVDVDPVDRVALEARLNLAEGDPVAALRTLSQAKQRWGDDGRVWAAETELFAFLQRLQGAQNSLEEGLEKAGNCPELMRSRAILALSIPGGAEVGLEHLERALELDPNLPFARHALAQAHLLVGNMELGREASEGDPSRALEHARAALAWDPLDLDYRQLEAEALAALQRFDEALERFDEIAAEGRDNVTLRANLHHSAATAALMSKDRDRAVEHYLAARALGLGAEELGFGQSVLREECDDAIERGLEHYGNGRLAEARAAFERALELDPESLSARNHLGVIHFRQGDMERAARAWRIVFEESEREHIDLPEPVHLNLARALVLLDDLPGARAACATYLDAHPDGPFTEDTRTFLTDLEITALNRDR